MNCLDTIPETLLKVKPFCQRGQQGHQDAAPFSRDDGNASAYAGQGSTCASVPPFAKNGISNTSESQNQTLCDCPKAIAVTNSDPTSWLRIDPLTCGHSRALQCLPETATFFIPQKFPEISHPLLHPIDSAEATLECR